MAQFLHGYASFTDPLSNTLMGDNFYYSRPQMAVYGSATVDGLSEPVAGVGWFDREWDACCFGGFFHNPPTFTQWDWAGFHLSDGSSWSFYDIFTQGNRQAVMSLTANYLDSPLKNCSQQAFAASDFTLTNSGSWVSPHSGHNYPTSWHFTVPSKGLDVVITPKIQDQEMTQVPVFLGFQPAYEGWAHVTGTRNGVPVTGDGYLELFGYP
jgi:predicted secreted hydrolase